LTFWLNLKLTTFLGILVLLESKKSFLGKSRQDIENERLLNLSLVRLLEIMGEAANFISSDLQTKYSKIEWSQIIGMRNRLIHGYDNIDYDILYQTIKKDIPPLIVGLNT